MVALNKCLTAWWRWCISTFGFDKRNTTICLKVLACKECLHRRWVHKQPTHLIRWPYRMAGDHSTSLRDCLVVTENIFLLEYHPLQFPRIIATYTMAYSKNDQKLTLPARTWHVCHARGCIDAWSCIHTATSDVRLRCDMLVRDGVILTGHLRKLQCMCAARPIKSMSCLKLTTSKQTTENVLIKRQCINSVVRHHVRHTPPVRHAHVSWYLWKVVSTNMRQHQSHKSDLQELVLIVSAC